jgi:hypothetical protein
MMEKRRQIQAMMDTAQSAIRALEALKKQIGLPRGWSTIGEFVDIAERLIWMAFWRLADIDSELFREEVRRYAEGKED